MSVALDEPGTRGEPERIAFLYLDLGAGGGTIFVLNLAGELRRRGFVCQVFSMVDTNPLARDFERIEVGVTICSAARTTIIEDRTLQTWEALRAFCPSAIVVSASMDACEVMRYVPAELQRIVVFHAAHQEHLEMARTYRSAIDLAVGVSPLVTEGLCAFVPEPPPEVLCIPLGLHSAKSLERPGILAGAPLRVLYLGRLEDLAKRVRLFPRILQDLRATPMPFHWTIAGGGPERTWLETEMRPLAGDLGTVAFTGIVPHAEVPALLAEHDVLLLTSDSESFCLSLHEAMNAGLVPVVSAIPGPVGKAVTPAVGLQVPPDDIGGYARAIVWLHEHRVEMAAMARASATVLGREFSMERMVDQWEGLLRLAPASPPRWSEAPRIQMPLRTSAPWRFSAPGRWLRRAVVWARRFA